MVAVEFSRFYNYYSSEKDLNSESSTRSPQELSRGYEGGGKDGSVRYFINVGEKDGYDWMSLKDFLRDSLDLEKDDIQRVDVKESFSFFNSDEILSAHILSTFTDFKVDGRFVNVEISKNPDSGPGKKKKKEKGRHKKDLGGKSSRKRDFSGKKGNKPGNRRSKKRDGFY
jgi:ATP-dependent RNA helicase DeaD